MTETLSQQWHTAHLNGGSRHALPPPTAVNILARHAHFTGTVSPIARPLSNISQHSRSGSAMSNRHRSQSAASRKGERPSSQTSIVSDSNMTYRARRTSIAQPRVPFDAATANVRAQNITVDTSRAKSNRTVVRLCIERLGWKEYSNGRGDERPCHIYWHNVVYNDLKHVLRNAPHSSVNKFPGMNGLARKAALTRCLNSLWRLFPDEYNFYPRSWLLPEQRDVFLAECERRYLAAKQTEGVERAPWYIVKPDDGAQGDGIYLMQKPDQLQPSENNAVVQEYVARPFLLNDSKKFDLRVYVVIRSLNPLSIYIYREGMVRFCTQPYSRPTESNRLTPFVHLTNYSLNKYNEKYVHTTSLNQEGGNKRLLSTVFHQLEARGVNTRKIWHNIQLVVVKTVMAMVPEMMLNYEHTFTGAHAPHCFQILGFDVLLTDDLRPILLEINACPSLSLEHKTNEDNDEGNTVENVPPMISVVDEAIKVPLVYDTLRLVMGMLDNGANTKRLRHLHGSALERSMHGSTSALFSDMLSTDESRFAPPTTLVGDRGIPHATLTEIFPANYEQTCRPLLTLDKAAYLYMQFVPIRRTLAINQTGLKQFVRKCRLSDIISNREIDAYFNEQQTRYATTDGKGLSFQGFVEFLMLVAHRYINVHRSRDLRAEQLLMNNRHSQLLTAFDLMIDHCVTKLRYHGVRSARLRHKRVTVSTPDAGDDDDACSVASRASNSGSVVEIYMLPSRVPPQVWKSMGARERASQEAEKRYRVRQSHSMESVRHTTTLPRIEARV